MILIRFTLKVTQLLNNKLKNKQFYTMKRYIQLITTLFSLLLLVGCEQTKIIDELSQEEITLDNIDKYVSPNQAILLRKLGKERELKFRLTNSTDKNIPEICEALVDSIINSEPLIFVPTCDSIPNVIENKKISNITTRAYNQTIETSVGVFKNRANVVCELWIRIGYSKSEGANGQTVFDNVYSDRVRMTLSNKGIYGKVDYKSYIHTAGLYTPDVITYYVTGKVIGFTMEAGEIVAESTVYNLKDYKGYYTPK